MIRDTVSDLLHSIKSAAMCFACGSAWPWAQQQPAPVKLYAPPVKDETIYLDGNTDFYPDYRKVRCDSFTFGVFVAT